MTKRRDLRLSKYGITRYRYRELYNFCLQYQEWMDELKYTQDALRAPSLSGLPGGEGLSDTTANLAVRRADLCHKCRLIEQSALAASGDLYQYIIKAVTNEGVAYDYCHMVMRIPCGRNKFEEIRRAFFVNLNEMLKIGGQGDTLS